MLRPDATANHLNCIQVATSALSLWAEEESMRHAKILLLRNRLIAANKQSY